jgi:hypothetical protein
LKAGWLDIGGTLTLTEEDVIVKLTALAPPGLKSEVGSLNVNGAVFETMHNITVLGNVISDGDLGVISDSLLTREFLVKGSLEVRSGGDLTTDGVNVTVDVNMTVAGGVDMTDGNLTVKGNADIIKDLNVADGDITVNGNLSAVDVTAGGDLTVAGSVYITDADITGEIDITGNLFANDVTAGENIKVAGSVDANNVDVANGAFRVVGNAAVNNLIADSVWIGYDLEEDDPPVAIAVSNLTVGGYAVVTEEVLVTGNMTVSGFNTVDTDKIAMEAGWLNIGGTLTLTEKDVVVELTKEDIPLPWFESEMGSLIVNGAEFRTEHTIVVIGNAISDGNLGVISGSLRPQDFIVEGSLEVRDGGNLTTDGVNVTVDVNMTITGGVNITDGELLVIGNASVTDDLIVSGGSVFIVGSLTVSDGNITITDGDLDVLGNVDANDITVTDGDIDVLGSLTALKVETNGHFYVIGNATLHTLIADKVRIGKLGATIPSNLIAEGFVDVRGGEVLVYGNMTI